MNTFSEKDLYNLMQVKDRNCISIFMPTSRNAAENEKNQIRFKNLIKRAEKTFNEENPGEKAVNKLIEPMQKLLDNGLFWRYQSDGLAVFAAPVNFFYYRMPVAFDELVVSGKRFHLKPLLRMLAGDGSPFYILALSQNQVRLIRCIGQSTETIELQGISGGLKETLGYEDIGKDLQFHQGTTAGGSRRSSIFHGGGVGTGGKKNEILQYFREIDKEVTKALAGDKAPLVLCGVEYLLPLYRDVNSYKYLLDEWITGNPESLTPEKLSGKALGLVRPYFEKELEDSLSRYFSLAGTGQASEDLETIVKASFESRVETIFFAIGIRKWGNLDEAENAVIIHDEKLPDSEDLLDLAVMMTLTNGGKAYALQPERMPRGAPLAAIFRF